MRLAGFPGFTGTTIVSATRARLRFSMQNLHRAVSDRRQTYRRCPLLAGTALFGVSSLAGGLTANATMLTGAQLILGVGAATVAPATTGKGRPSPRLGVWEPSATACSR